MSRRHASEKREILPDTKYKDVLVSKFINKIMKQGKKELAERIVYSAFQKVEQKYKIGALEAFKNAYENVRPYFRVEPLRIGGATYQVPSPVPELKGYSLAIDWIINAARNRSSEKRIEEKIAEEMYEASNNKGAAVKKKDDTHKMAEANKPFAHFSTKKYKSH